MKTSNLVLDQLLKVTDFIDGRFCIKFIKFQYWMFVVVITGTIATIILMLSLFFAGVSILFIERTLILNTYCTNSAEYKDSSDQTDSHLNSKVSVKAIYYEEFEKFDFCINFHNFPLN